MVQQATSTGNEADIPCRLQKEELEKLMVRRVVYPPRVECRPIYTGASHPSQPGDARARQLS